MHAIFMAIWIGLWWLAEPCLPASAIAAEEAAGQVTIDYFHDPGCSECRKVSEQVLPQLAAQYPSRYILRACDIGDETNYARLMAFLERVGMPGRNERVFIVVDERHVLAGYPEISRRLLDTVEQCLRSRGARETTPRSEAETGRTVAGRLLRRFTPAGVFLAGLVDGLNPCAFSTLVFFVSVLAVSRIRGCLFILGGAAFCAASFVTYFALGLGLLRMLHGIAAFRAVQRLLDPAIATVLIVFAVLSFRDAARFRAQGKPEAVTLQLPARIRTLIHRIAREGIRPAHVVTSALLVGSAVTVLESVCTGQVYLPTLVYVVRSGEAVAQGLFYLTLYNTAFTLPLIVVLALSYQGLRVQSLVNWSARSVAGTKVAMGFFFLLMAAILFILN